MVKLVKLLKSSVVWIIAAFVFIIIQAQCDLAMPGYISDIVNVGIQQGGIENVVPVEIRQSEMDKLTLFMSQQEKQTVLNSYKSKQNNGVSTFELKEVDSATIEKLNDIFLIPVGVVSWISEGTTEVQDLKDRLVEMLPDNNISSEDDIFTILSSIPSEELDSIMPEIVEEFQSMEKNLLSQMGIPYIKTEYSTLGIDTKKMQMSYIYKTGMEMLLIAVATALTITLLSLSASRIGAIYGREIRSSLYRKVMTFSNNEFNKFSVPSLITRCTNDIQQVQFAIVNFIRVVVYAPIIGVGALLKVFRASHSLTWVVGLAVSCLLLLIFILFGIATSRFKMLQRLVDKLNQVSREILTGLPVIRAFNREEHEAKRFERANRDIMKTSLFISYVMSIMMPAMMFIMNGASLLIIWVGADVINAGAMQVGDLIAFIEYTMQIIMAFLMLSMMSISLPRSMVSARRIADVLDADVTVKDTVNPREMESNIKGLIEFKNVTYRYPNAKEDVLKNLSFTVKPGETTAVIGSTGSGKTTLVNLIPRFFDVTEGQILLDGIDIREFSLRDLRDKIGYVPQKSILFSGTIESNIGYGEKPVSIHRIKKAAEIAQASEFIAEKSKKYQSRIAQGGTNVSGGQRQRLSIARAIAKKPKIYIFDDSFSALDYKTDAKLRKALNEATKDSTILVVTQRISTTLSADQVIVLNDRGEIAGIGKHEDLIKNCQVYRQIALSQLSKEEIEV